MNWHSGITVVLAVILIAVLVNYVFFQNETRKLFAASQAIEKEKLELNSEFARLQLEKSTLVANNRIEQVARDQLNMKLPEDEQVLVIVR
ncbi:cell division protein FtsL [Marinicella sp. S1101]|uniref:cell division protein FtsL n=1 Tax=Marinicella marina TaxID=2996016 RepID=UPI002260B957|nr:cell division protein FtsL [Marinicella marina]MCX7553877.1 cell division protein FtsL [Marinicella marina]MDJ1140369.1 cell division protein FtsL [Marinicella marina]